MAATRARLTDGRWHFQHGPMDIVIGADGAPDALAAAHETAFRRFETLLDELVSELAHLRAPVAPSASRIDAPFAGEVARAMWRACWPYRQGFITPMAAVAGAVADALLPAYRGDGIARAYLNNGGDIALHLAPGASLRLGVFGDLARLAQGGDRALALDGHCDIQADMPVRGIATSGWRGRSFSMGIADSVTVLARTAAEADAAATVIANAVNVADARILRAPAASLKDDSDLGERLVTVEVPPLDVDTLDAALAAGLARAESLRAAGLVHGALLLCQGRARVCGNTALLRAVLPGAQPALTSSRAALDDRRVAGELGSVIA